MTQIIDRRFLLIQKFCRLRDSHGEVYAREQFTRAEHDDIFEYLVACHTADNLKPNGTCKIPKSLQ